MSLATACNLEQFLAAYTSWEERLRSVGEEVVEGELCSNILFSFGGLYGCLETLP